MLSPWKSNYKIICLWLYGGNISVSGADTRKIKLYYNLFSCMVYVQNHSTMVYVQNQATMVYAQNQSAMLVAVWRMNIISADTRKSTYLIIWFGDTASKSIHISYLIQNVFIRYLIQNESSRYLIQNVSTRLDTRKLNYMIIYLTV